MVVAAIGLLTGCAQSYWGDQATSGGAVYEYSRSISPQGVETCTARATSSREIMGGTIKVGENCEFEASVDEVSSPFEVIDRVLDLVPTPVQ